MKGLRPERNQAARIRCLEIHGFACKACGVDLEKRYGPLAAGLIDVHHKIPIAEAREEREVDFVNDLVPLCPNCHRVAHRRDPPLSVEELRQLLRASS